MKYFYSRICPRTTRSISFFSTLIRKFCSNPKFPKCWSLKRGMDFLVAWITHNGFSCCSKYHSRGFLYGQNTISIGFLVALITLSIDLFVFKASTLWFVNISQTKLWKPLTVHEHPHQMQNYCERKTNHIKLSIGPNLMFENGTILATITTILSRITTTTTTNTIIATKNISAIFACCLQ